jgi:hypothetical protein
MSYYLHEQPVTEDINKYTGFCKRACTGKCGACYNYEIDTNILLRQIDAVRAASANGVGIFELQSIFNGGYDSALKLGVFRYPAITNRDTEQSVSLVLQDIIRKIDDIYLKCGGMNDEEAQKYKKLVRDIKVNFKGSKDAVKNADLLKDKT